MSDIMTIMVVEDEIVVADNLIKTLTKVGYKCLEPALNYTSALERLKEKPDLAFLDINLGGKLNGIDVAKEINSTRPIPFLYLTAYSDEKTFEEAKATRPYGYLIKPFKKEEIKPAVELATMNYSNRFMGRHETFRQETLTLTPAEKSVLQNIANQMTTKEIAEHLNISLSTVKNHRHNICVKLDLAPTNNALLSWVLMNKDFLI